MTQPSKEYRARISVRLTDDLLPGPALSKADLEAHLIEALHVGEPGSPIVSVRVDDPANQPSKRRR